ncbi:MAG TPA: hypothetical protein VM187_06015 [Niastella sp.]|nr:hypothetical protein [Niastella sp.]
MLAFFLLTVGLIVLFIILLFVGIAKKRRKPVYIALILFLLAIPAGLYTSFLLAQKAYKKLKSTKIENPLKRRTGMEMYTALFGMPETNCVTVINSQDAYIPKIDCCIWLEFTTCANEIKRIIDKKGLSPYVSSDNLPNYSPRPKWFVPDNLGAGYIILRKHNPDDPNHDEILYLSKNSTRAYYCNMAQ